MGKIIITNDNNTNVSVTAENVKELELLSGIFFLTDAFIKHVDESKYEEVLDLLLVDFKEGVMALRAISDYTETRIRRKGCNGRWE